MNVAIYCRVSTLEQKEHGYSIEEQERKLKQFCEINDWNVADVFVDAGFSGAKRDRPELQRMMNDIKRFDLILVYKLDRLTRNVRDLLDLLEIFEQNNIAFRSATEVYDTSTAMGRLFVTLVGAMAEWERETIRERTQMGRRSAARKGLAKTTPPFYYDRVDDKFVPNKYKKVVRYAVDEVLKGISLREVVRRLNNSNIKPPSGKVWHRSAIHHALTNPVSRGHYVFQDILVEHTHDAIITEEEYKLITERLSDKTNSKVVSHVAIFRGKIRCPQCDSKLTLNTSKRKNINETVIVKTYYCDKCKYDKSVQSINLKDEEVMRVFKAYLEDFDLTLYDEPKKKNDNPITIDIDKIMEQRKRYHKLYANGLMQEEELFELIKETDDAIKEYEKQKNTTEVKQFDVEYLRKHHRLLIELLNVSNEEEIAEFIQMAIKRIDIKYIKGIRGKTLNTMEIENVEFY